MTLRGMLLAGVALLYVASIPWYRTSGTAPALLLGLPDWVTISLACYAAASVLNAIAWLVTDLRDDDEEADARRGGER